MASDHRNKGMFAKASNSPSYDNFDNFAGGNGRMSNASNIPDQFGLQQMLHPCKYEFLG